MATKLLALSNRMIHLRLLQHTQYRMCLYTLNKGYNFCSSSDRNVGFENESLYHNEADRIMDIVTEKCDDLFELTNDDFDYKTASGVLNIDFGSSIGIWVLNKQAPNQQLWLSSPMSGPHHYDYDYLNKKWISSKDGHGLSCLLKNEFSQIVGSEIDFSEEF